MKNYFYLIKILSYFHFLWKYVFPLAPGRKIKLEFLERKERKDFILPELTSTEVVVFEDRRVFGILAYSSPWPEYSLFAGRKIKGVRYPYADFFFCLQCPQDQLQNEVYTESLG